MASVGAAIDMLDNALRACPDELWQERLYNERQEHAAQLSLFLGQKVGSAPGWVAKAQSKDIAA